MKYFGLGLFRKILIAVGFLVSGIQGSTGFILSGTQGSTSTATGTPKQRSCHHRKEMKAFSSKASDGRCTQPADIDVSLLFQGTAEALKR